MMKSVNATITLTTEQINRLNNLWNITSYPNPDDFVASVIDAGLYQIAYRREYTKKVNEQKKEAMKVYRAAQKNPELATKLGLAHTATQAAVTRTDNGQDNSR